MKVAQPQTKGGHPLRISKEISPGRCSQQSYGVLDLTGDLAASRQKIGTIAGTSRERMGVQAVTVELPESLSGLQ